MATKPRLFPSELFYHIYNCGVEKRPVFTSGADYSRFIETVNYYLYTQTIRYSQFHLLCEKAKQLYLDIHPKGVGTLRVHLIAYCLMPNHYHFVIKPVTETSITAFMSDISNSYTKYFNTKNKRVGSLFQGPFKAKGITSLESLLQVTRYVHLNPCKSSQTNSNGALLPEDYLFSSYKEWLNLIHPSGVKSPFGVEVDKGDVENWLREAGMMADYRRFVESMLYKDEQLLLGDLAIDYST